MISKKNLNKIIKKVVNYELKNCAYSTTSGALYQPLVPTDLKKYSKIDK